MKLRLLPDSLDAQARVTVAYRAVALKSFVPDGGTGGGCSTYSSCMQIKYDYECAAKVRDEGSARFCFLHTYGECSSDTTTSSSGGGSTSTTSSIWYAGGVGGTAGGYTPTYESIPGAQCIPKPPECPICEALKQGRAGALQKPEIGLGNYGHDHRRFVKEAGVPGL